MYLANPCNEETVQQMGAGNLGLIDTPYQAKVKGVVAAHALGSAWCADNGAYANKWEADVWWDWLTSPRQMERRSTCLFAVAPDVVGDAAATLARSLPWLPKIRALGYPVAFVAQDGLGIHWNGALHVGDLDGPTISWDEFDCLFIGGSTEWKLGTQARALVAEAKRRGKWVHGGRCNSQRRFEYFRAIGCDSVDGTYLTFGPDTNLPKLLAWTRNNDQPGMFEVSA
jgi:hypothetical protein